MHSSIIKVTLAKLCFTGFLIMSDNVLAIKIRLKFNNRYHHWARISSEDLPAAHRGKKGIERGGLFAVFVNRGIRKYEKQSKFKQ
jgi:hypothetical protein